MPASAIRCHRLTFCQRRGANPKADSFELSSSVVRLLSACCPLFNRTTTEQQVYINWITDQVIAFDIKPAAKMPATATR